MLIAVNCFEIEAASNTDAGVMDVELGFAMP